MALLVNNTNGINADYVAKTTVAGGFNLQSNHTLACRIRWTGTTSIEMYNMFWSANANQSGQYMTRQAGDTANLIFGRRYNTIFTTNDSASYGTGSYSGTSAWHHYAQTYDGTNIRTYVDGVLANTTASSASRVSSTTSTNLGIAVAGTCVMADAAFFARALTADEILWLTSGRLANLLGKGDCFGFYPFHFDSRLKDYSGLGNDLSDVAGTGTAPAADNEGIPVPWSRSNPRIVLPAPIIQFSSGTSTTTTAATGTLRVRVKYDTNAALSPTSAVGTLRVRISFTTNSSVTVSAATGTLAVRKKFDTNAAVSPTAAQGSLVLKPTFSSNTCVSPTAAVGVLAVKKLFAGTCTTTTACTGTVQARQLFASGSCVSPTAAVGQIAAKMVFDGNQCLSRSAAVGGLTVLGAISFAGTCSTTSAATGFLQASRQFAGACASVSAAQGSLVARKNLAGACATTSAAVGTLRVRVLFAGVCVTPSAATFSMTGGTVVNPMVAEDDRNRQDRRRMSFGLYRRPNRR